MATAKPHQVRRAEILSEIEMTKHSTGSWAMDKAKRFRRLFRELERLDKTFGK